MTSQSYDAPVRVGRSHTCPWWVGYILASPLRRLIEHPDKLLAPHVQPGDTVIDLGCAMGYFSLPMARMVGDQGRVICVDVQERMLASLRGKIRRDKLEAVVETRLCADADLGLDDLVGSVDMVLAWHVVHEVDDRAAFLRQCSAVLRPGGRMLLAEPNGHVSDEDLRLEVALAREVGLIERGIERNRRNTIVMLEK